MRFVHELLCRMARAFHWPVSAPDYRWPGDFAPAHSAWRRAGLSALFHVAHAAGRLVGLVLRGTPGVLVIRTDGIGDALLFEPALQSLGQRFSPRSLHLWAPAHTCDLLRACPSVERRAALPGGFKPGNLNYFASPWWRMAIGYRLGRWRFEMAMYPSNSPEPMGNWLLRSVRAAQRWYCPGDLSNQFEHQRDATAQAATLLLEPALQGHELHRNARLAAQWSDEPLRGPRVHVDDAARERAQSQMTPWRRLREVRGAAGLVGVVPAASLASKQYPIDRWASALRILWEQDRLMPALLGGPGDQGTLDALALALKDVLHLRLERPVDLPAMGALMARLDGVISVDTGLAHIAVAQDVPTVVLLTGAIPGRFFPWPSAPHHKVLNLPMPCDGCHSRCVHAKPLCITEIAPEQIVMAFRSLRAPQVTIDVSRRAVPLARAG